MLEITDYTLDTAHEFYNSSDLEDYLEANEGHEIGVSYCSEVSIPNLAGAIKWLDYSDEEREQITVVAKVHGHSYYNDLDEALSSFEELNYIRVEDASTVYQTAHKLDFELYLEDELLTLLSCSKESYEQLGRYVSTDDIANLLEVEYNVSFVGNTAYIILST